MTDELIEQVARAIDKACIAYSKSHAGLNLRKWDTPGEVMATAALAAARPAILAEGARLGLEAASKEMEDLCFFTPIEELLHMTKCEMSERTCHEGAKAIRALDPAEIVKGASE